MRYRIQHIPRRDCLPRDEYGRKVVAWVGRPSRWGNPHRLASVGGTCELCGWDHEDRLGAVAMYRREVTNRADLDEFLAPLARFEGLACACPLDDYCHADVLIQLLEARWPSPKRGGRPRGEQT